MEELPRHQWGHVTNGSFDASWAWIEKTTKITRFL
jgi:hypothetical protein